MAGKMAGSGSAREIFEYEGYLKDRVELFQFNSVFSPYSK